MGDDAKIREYKDIEYCGNPNAVVLRMDFGYKATLKKDYLERVHELILTDYEITIDGEILNIDSELFYGYTQFLTKIYGTEYALGFHRYRNDIKNDIVRKFDDKTNGLMKKLLAVIDEKKNTQTGINLP